MHLIDLFGLVLLLGPVAALLPSFPKDRCSLPEKYAMTHAYTETRTKLPVPVYATPALMCSLVPNATRFTFSGMKNNQKQVGPWDLYVGSSFGLTLYINDEIVKLSTPASNIEVMFHVLRLLAFPTNVTFYNPKLEKSRVIVPALYVVEPQSRPVSPTPKIVGTSILSGVFFFIVVGLLVFNRASKKRP